ncbi:MAG: hypothetical protein M3040_06325 [Bacteroidota bacterium]|nr:hypothetical protein [Bacteroidota bacterium]
MTSIKELIITTHTTSIVLFAILFFVKLALFLRDEKGWDSISFLHFTTISLKMTMSKELRKKRKLQNTITNVLLTVILFLSAISAFKFFID